MTTQTSAPIGSTGQSLEGVAVSTAAGANLFRESVVLADPNDPIGYGQVVSNQPASSATPYGAVMYLAGNPNISTTVNVTATALVTNTISTQVISSIPYFVSQSSAPWDMRGGINVTAAAAVMSTWPLNTTLAQIVSSIPMAVVQSSGPWTVSATALPDIRCQVNVSAATAVMSTWPLNTTQVNVVSSLPINVSQSTSPWVVVLSTQTARGANYFTTTIANNLNTTVVKAGPGNLYSYAISNVSTTNVFVRFYDTSTASLVSPSSNAVYIVGSPASTVSGTFTGLQLGDIGLAFSSGIAFLTQRAAQIQGSVASSAVPQASSVVISLTYF